MIVAGLLALHNLDDETVAKLCKRLSDLGISLKLKDIVLTVDSVGGVDNAADLSKTLVSLCSAADQYGLEVLLRNVADSIEITEEFKEIDAQNREALLSKLRSLLTGKSAIKQFLKAIQVVQSHQQVFSECKILTDVRPVFNEIGDEPVAASIIHNLKISYGKDDNSRDFYVVLDDRDLKTLQEQINRAIIKSGSLQKLLSKSEIPCLISEDSDQDETIT
jgi:hypothetical protein